MVLTLGQLRRMIREFGVDDTIRHQAGFYDTGGVSSNITDREAIMDPPPGLGGPEDQDEYDEDDQQEKSQAGVRVFDRNPRGFGL